MSMNLIRLTYFSRSRLGQSCENYDARVHEIARIAAINNRRDDITAALICDDRWFAQVIEGRESIVSLTFERILRDQRHSDVSLVTMQPIADRRYADYAMVTISRSQDNDDLFRHYCEDQHFDPRQMRADRLCDLIEAVVQRGAKGAQSWTTESATSAA
jgi:hypothetical protein